MHESTWLRRNGIEHAKDDSGITADGGVRAFPCRSGDGRLRQAVVDIRRDTLEISLDPGFPRVLAYEVEGRGRLLGAREQNRGLIELNGQIYSAGDYTVACTTDGSKVDYTVTIAPARLRLGLRFEALPVSCH